MDSVGFRIDAYLKQMGSMLMFVALMSSMPIFFGAIERWGSLALYQFLWSSSGLGLASFLGNNFVDFVASLRNLAFVVVISMRFYWQTKMLVFMCNDCFPDRRMSPQANTSLSSVLCPHSNASWEAS